MSKSPTISAAFYSPSKGVEHQIAREHLGLLSTTYKVDDLVVRLAQKCFNIGEDNDFDITINRNRITVKACDENGSPTTYSLDRDASSSKWHIQQANSNITDSEINQNVDTIIRLVKAVWSLNQNQTPASSISQPPNVPVSSTQVGPPGHPITINNNHCCHCQGQCSSGDPSVGVHVSQQLSQPADRLNFGNGNQTLVQENADKHNAEIEDLNNQIIKLKQQINRFISMEQENQLLKRELENMEEELRKKIIEINHLKNKTGQNQQILNSNLENLNSLFN